MGHVLNTCNCVTVCCEKNSHQIKNQQDSICPGIENYSKKYSIISQTKPRDKNMIGPYQAYDNFCLILKNVIKMQRAFRVYRTRKNNLKKITTGNSGSLGIISNNTNANTNTNIIQNFLFTLNSKKGDDKDDTETNPSLRLKTVPSSTHMNLNNNNHNNNNNNNNNNNYNVIISHPAGCSIQINSASFNNDDILKEREVSKETTLVESLINSQKIVESKYAFANKQYVSAQTITSFFSHESESQIIAKESQSEKRNAMIHYDSEKHKESNKTELSALNPRDINGNFLRKPKKGFKFKGTVNKITHKKEGFGIVTWEDGSKFYSRFTANQSNGICKFINASVNSVYGGEYHKNIPIGYGFYFSKDLQVSYEGKWEKNYLNGIGTEIWKDETYYQGEFLETRKNGIGLYRWPDGTIYQGEWKDNQMTGYGMILYTDDKVYCGELQCGKMNGYGEFSWKNGTFYSGNYVNDKKNGFGVFVWCRKPLNMYIGFWSEGKRNGVGISINDTSTRYAVWKDGKKEFELLGPWEIDKYLKNQQMKYNNYLQKELNGLLSVFNLSIR